MQHSISSFPVPNGRARHPGVRPGFSPSIPPFPVFNPSGGGGAGGWVALRIVYPAIGTVTMGGVAHIGATAKAGDDQRGCVAEIASIGAAIVERSTTRATCKLCHRGGCFHVRERKPSHRFDTAYNMIEGLKEFLKTLETFRERRNSARWGAGKRRCAVMVGANATRPFRNNSETGAMIRNVSPPCRRHGTSAESSPENYQSGATRASVRGG